MPCFLPTLKTYTLMKDILLSFCIATHNKAEIVCKLANSILKCGREDIEVVVTDDASTDNTIELLSTISDERFVYCRNEYNVGAFANFVISLTNAKGKYAFYCNDRDHILHENIGKLCDFLAANELSFAYCDNVCKRDVIYKNSAKAFRDLAKDYHPTGVVFNVEKLKTIENIEWYQQIDNVKTSPFSFLACKLMVMGNSARLKNIYWELVELEFLSANISGNQSLMAKDNKSLYSVNAKSLGLLLTKFIMDMNCFDKTRLYRILFNVYKRTVFNATIAYRYWAIDKYMSAHYGCSPYKVNNQELMAIYKGYYDEYTQLVDYHNIASYRLKFSLYKIWLYLLVVGSHIIYIDTIVRIWHKLKYNKLVGF
jgi:glycosyltransferase involved in cell wall biosynthesis